MWAGITVESTLPSEPLDQHPAQSFVTGLLVERSGIPFEDQVV
jgi:hypothetical protein